MITTNLLLKISLSIVTNFQSAIVTTDNALLQNESQLQRYVIGSPYSPVDCYLIATNGLEFWVRDGVVFRFRSKGSFFQLQDTAKLDAFHGVSKFTTDEILQHASTALERLAITKTELQFFTPALQVAGGKYPFYRVTFMNDSRKQPSPSATVEVDGRTGNIVYLRLLDSSFYNYDLAQQISNKVYSVDVAASRSKAAISNKTLRPSTNYVQQAIGVWLQCCENLNLKPGDSRSIDCVDWERTVLGTNLSISVEVPIAQVWFTNGACFEAINGVVFGSYAPDARFAGIFWEKDPKEVARYEGKVSKRWQDLAQALESAIVDKLKIPKELFASFSPSPSPYCRRPDFGSEAMARALIDWRNWPKNLGRTVWVDETRRAFTAEFDLQSGELKMFRFDDPILIHSLMRNAGASLVGEQ